ncbi:MAG: hypothetical protein IBX40_09855 [Methanosarcinales archaeon]|nr:hypothetical protein [Methanosarcinales archaeon]
MRLTENMNLSTWRLNPHLQGRAGRQNNRKAPASHLTTRLDLADWDGHPG